MSTGYKYKRVNGKLVRAHRYVWEQYNGDIPEGMQVDHINGDRADNRIENLRLVTPQQNTWNRKKPPKVDKLTSGNYRVRLCKDGKHIGIGTYKDKELAEFIAYEARVHYFGEYA